MAEHLRLANTEGAPILPPDFLMTETARNIQRSLDLIDMMPGAAMTIVSGAPGVGKTAALRNFVKADPDAMMMTGAGGEGSAMHLSAELCQRFRIDYSCASLTARRHALVSRIDHRRLIVICDECQHYSNDAIEWLRAVSEQADFKVVLCGDETLAPRIAVLKQLASRMVRPVVITSVKKHDVAVYAQGHGLRGDDVINALHSIAILKGGLRNVRNVLHLATRFSGEGPVQLDHIIAAIGNTGLAAKEDRS